MIINDAIAEMIENIEKLSSALQEETINQMIDIIMSSENIFILGLGRSGLVAKAFAMRLMHLGINVFVVGETITPAIYGNDCLLAISGSGETSNVLSTAEITKKRGAKIIAVTSYPTSTLAGMSDLVVEVKGRTKIDGEQNYNVRQMNGKHQSLAPLGTLFEVTSLIFLDGFIAQLMDKMEKTEEDMKMKHNVLE